MQLFCCLIHLSFAFCQSTPLFFFLDSIVEWILGTLHHIQVGCGLLHCLPSSTGGGSVMCDMVLVCVSSHSQNDAHGFILHPVHLQQIGKKCQPCETKAMVKDAENHTLMQLEQVAPFDAFCSHGFSYIQSFMLHLSSID